MPEATLYEKSFKVVGKESSESSPGLYIEGRILMNLIIYCIYTTQYNLHWSHVNKEFTKITVSSIFQNNHYLLTTIMTIIEKRHKI